MSCCVIIQYLSVSCTGQITRAACSWVDLLDNWPPNSELLSNNSLLELIYFLNKIFLKSSYIYKIERKTHRFRYTKIVSVKLSIFYYPSILTDVLGAQKNHLILIETVLLSTHNICLGWIIRKINFRYTLLTKVLLTYTFLRHLLI